jgi:hypothetical protein
VKRTIVNEKIEISRAAVCKPRAGKRGTTAEVARHDGLACP